MTQREWVERDFYADLGVTSTATADEIKKAYRKLARELHPDANPGDEAAEERFKRVSEAYTVLADADKRKEYDEARRIFSAGGGFSPGGGSRTGGRTGGFSPGGFSTADFDLGDLFGQATGGGDAGDIFGGLFNRGTRPSRPSRGNDIETEMTIDFREAARGSVLPIRLTSPSPCTTCHGSGARPGTSPKVCARCNGSGVVSRNQGHFGFSEPCVDCRGTGSIVDSPCTDCSGTGVTTRERTISVRVPSGVKDGQRIRLAGQGQAGMRGAPSGDLYVTVHVRPDRVFGRDGDNLTVTAPVTFGELALGTTLHVPTLDSKVGVKVPAGTKDGRTLRVRGRGVPKRSGGAGDLLVTVRVAVPNQLDSAAKDALETYIKAEKESGFDPRADWAGA
ncbi:molecular chaperone DnaJ [Tomitella gaofuii]|uniref:molecular chaperone DnaJ n=1 Tax=Tomitella gaofuii TaxID=2760083 RepID=UPI0015FC9891|nr:molecular chaperone DnaJ [Tomitella gaofuii]